MRWSRKTSITKDRTWSLRSVTFASVATAATQVAVTALISRTASTNVSLQEAEAVDLRLRRDCSCSEAPGHSSRS